VKRTIFAVKNYSIKERRIASAGYQPVDDKGGGKPGLHQQGTHELPTSSDAGHVSAIFLGQPLSLQTEAKEHQAQAYRPNFKTSCAYIQQCFQHGQIIDVDSRSCAHALNYSRIYLMTYYLVYWVTHL